MDTYNGLHYYLFLASLRTLQNWFSSSLYNHFILKNGSISVTSRRASKRPKRRLHGTLLPLPPLLLFIPLFSPCMVLFTFCAFKPPTFCYNARAKELSYDFDILKAEAWPWYFLHSVVVLCRYETMGTFHQCFNQKVDILS